MLWSARKLCFHPYITPVDPQPKRWSYSIGMCRPWLQFVESDDERAALFAHILAHALLKTTGDSVTVSWRERELLADELAWDLMARSGYDVAAASAIWERFALEHPWLIAPGERARGHTWVGERLGPMRDQVERLRANRPGAEPLPDE